MEIIEIKCVTINYIYYFFFFCASQSFFYRVITIYFVYVQYLLYLVVIDIVTAKRFLGNLIYVPQK